ncbi:MAG: hypothetical protein PHF74_05570 [Dehalococcoidales bacterium]|nr:hypothetical protein [Dehalococcoidales bacterium]
MSIKLPTSIMLPPVPKRQEELFGLHGYFMQLDVALKDYARSVYRAMTYLTRSTTFNATTDWGTASGGYYTITFEHNLDLSHTAIAVLDTTTGEDAITVDRARVVDNNSVSIRVLSSPDLRFAGKIIVSGI